MFEPKILYEDNDLLVVEKPAGMVVNRSETSSENTVQDWVEKNYNLGKYGDKVFLNRSGIAHRLDKETSGCLLIAKNPDSLKALMAQFKERNVKKDYLAFVHGRLEPKEGTIKLPIGRDRIERKKRKVMVEGKTAETSWQVLKYIDGYSLVKLNLKTGRTHQIRVHLAYLGHPIVADSLYLNKKLKLTDRQKIDRHLLHAYSVEFTHPKTKKKILINSTDPKFDKLIKV